MAEQARLLLADHRPGCRTAVAAALRSSGYRVEEAGTATSLMKAVGHHRHDLLLLREDLPGLDCAAFCEQHQRTRVSQPDGGPEILLLPARTGMLPAGAGPPAAAPAGPTVRYLDQPVTSPGFLQIVAEILKSGPPSQALVAVRPDADPSPGPEPGPEPGPSPPPSPGVSPDGTAGTDSSLVEGKLSWVREPDFQNFVQSLNEGIWTVDQAVFTTYVNDYLAGMLGYRPEEMNGRHLFSFLDEKGIRICQKNLERRRQGISENLEFELLHREGRKVQTLMQTSPLTDEAGNYTGALAGVLDLTERRRMEISLRHAHHDLERRVRQQTQELTRLNEQLQKESHQHRRSEELFRKLLESAPDAMVICDQGGRIVLINSATERLFGYERADLIGEPVEILIPENLRSRHQQHRIRYEENPHRRAMGSGIELEARRQDGTHFPAEVSLGPLRTEQGVMVFSVIRDTTLRQQREREIQDNLNAQNVISSLLRISLEPLSLPEILQRALDLLLDLPWLNLVHKGAIFLVEKKQEVLVLKAQTGLPDSLLTSCAHLPIGRCLCGQAVRSLQTIFTSGLKRGPEIQNQDSQPLGQYCVPSVSEEEVYGVLNLYVEHGHQHNPKEEAFLNSVAAVLAVTIQHKQAEEALLAQETELRAAQRIQQQILPTRSPELVGFDMAGGYRPADFAGGDHFDYFLAPDGSLLVVVGDVSGHGFSSALLMASIHANLHLLASLGLPIEEICQRANKTLIQDSGTVNFSTTILVRIDPRTLQMHYVSAGHPTGYVLDASGRVKTQLRSTSLPLGMLGEAEFTTGPAGLLAPGDLILLLTDGILEAQSPQGEYFGKQRALEIVRKNQRRPPQAIVDRLCLMVHEYQGPGKQQDDITAVVVKVAADHGAT